MAADQVVVQDCGCIALPDEMASTLGVAAGSKLRVAALNESTLVLTRISERVASPQPKTTAACPIP